MYFLDVQGTLIDDDNKLPIEGAVEFIQKLNQKNIPYILITNNTKEKSGDFISYLQGLGFEIEEKNYIDPFYILKDILKDKKIKVFGMESFKTNLEDMGYEIDSPDVSAMVISVDKSYDSEAFSSMIETAFKVDNIVGMHGTSTYKKDGKRYPGVGAILSMINFATNKDYKIVGKPSELFFKKARDKMAQSFGLENLDFEDITLISDDFLGEIVGAKKLGISSYFVLSGKTKDPAEILDNAQEEYSPKGIYKNMADILNKVNI